MYDYHEPRQSAFIFAVIGKENGHQDQINKIKTAIYLPVKHGRDVDVNGQGLHSSLVGGYQHSQYLLEPYPRLSI